MIPTKWKCSTSLCFSSCTCAWRANTQKIQRQIRDHWIFTLSFSERKKRIQFTFLVFFFSPFFCKWKRSGLFPAVTQVKFVKKLTRARKLKEKKLSLNIKLQWHQEEELTVFFWNYFIYAAHKFWIRMIKFHLVSIYHLSLLCCPQ